MSEALYDPIAEWYDAYVRERPIYHEVVLPHLLALTGDVRGRVVCDVACGQGLVTRELARRGAQVTGVDIAEKMLELARRYEEEEPLGIRYLQDDAQTLSALPDASFDGATCSMALMNIDDLPATFAALHRILRPNGWFVCSITHPCFQPPHSEWIDKGDGRVVREVSGYFEERLWESRNPEGVRGKVGEHHRMLSTYLNALAGAGLYLERMVEPQVTGGRRAEQVPGEREVPSVLLMRLCRQALQ